MPECEKYFAQRKAVSAKEAIETFPYAYTGKDKSSNNEIIILARGGKLKISFDLVHPFTADNSALSANLWQAVGEADIKSDTAIHSTNEDGGMCKITIKFVKPRHIKVTQEIEVAGCSFGLNVSANGTYKISSAKPKFETVE